MAQVEIYTLTYCPFCRMTKQLLNSKGVEYTEYSVDDDEAARDAMVQRGSDGKRSVPQVFIDDVHIGGNDDLQKLEQQEKLDVLLA